MDQIHSEPRSDRMPPRWVLLILLCLAIFVRGRAMQIVPSSGNYDPDKYAALASNLVQRETLGDFEWSPSSPRLYYKYGQPSLGHRLPNWLRSSPQRSFSKDYGPTAYRPPLYPLLLAAPLYLLPNGPDLVGMIHIILGVVTVWATWRLGLAWHLPAWGALVAAGLVTFDPILINQSAQVMTETLATCLAAFALLALSRAVTTDSLRGIALAGGLFGLCVLCRPTFLVWFALVCLALPFVANGAWRRRLALVATFAAMTAVVLTPWAARNLRELGKPIITTTHGGYTLLLANNPEFYEYLRSGDWDSVWDAADFNRRWYEIVDETTRDVGGIVQVDEVACDRKAYELAWQNIRAEPAMFAYSCLVRVGRLWSVLPHQLSDHESPSRRGLRYAVAIWYSAELLLAAAGLWLLRKQLLAPPVVWGLLLLVSFTLVHTFYWTDMRMRAPLAIVVSLLAAQSVLVLAGGRRLATRVTATT